MATKKDTEEKQPESKASWLRLNGKEAGEEEFCAWIKRQVTEHPVVSNYHSKWKELLAWKEGDMFSQWSSKGGEGSGGMVPVEFKTGYRRSKVVVNLMKPLSEALSSKISFEHSIVGSPNSGENKDVIGAQVASKFIAFNDATINMDAIMDDLKYDLVNIGTACGEVFYDENMYGTIAPRENGKPNPDKEAKDSGDVSMRVVPIFNIRPDPTAKTPEEMRWIIELMELTKDELLRCYPDAKEAVLDAGPNNKSNKYLGMNVDPKEIDPKEETYTIQKYLERANEDYPKGRLIVTLGDRVIWAKKNPKPKAKLDYFFFFYYKNPYKFWSWGPLYYVQDPQRIINRLTSMAVDHVESWKAKAMVGKNAIKTAGAFTTDIAEIIEVDFSRGEPRPFTTPELSPQVAALREFFIGVLDRVANVHEVSYSQLPEGASRAPADLYRQMLEQENVKLDSLVNHANKTLLQIDTARLEFMDQHYTMARKVKIVGKNRASSVAYYDKTDLNGNFDVVLEKGVSLSQSSTVQTRLILEMWNQGLLDQADKPKILKMIAMGTGENLLRDDMADTEKAVRENQAFIDGTYGKKREEGGVSFFIHDDHHLHMDFHTTLVKTEEAMKWTEETMTAMLMHIQMHFQVLAVLQGQAAGTAAGGGASPSAAEASGIVGGAGAGAAGGSAAAPGPVPAPAAGAIAQPGVGTTAKAV